MDASPCGVCLIINNVEFVAGSELKSRKGSDIDCEKLERRFRALNFHVIVKRNLKCKVRVCVFSHPYNRESAVGEASHNRFPGAVHGVDGPSVPVQIITNYLNGQNCPSLQGKPKLFFIQACGGGEKDTGFEVSPDEVQPTTVRLDEQMDAIPTSSSSDSLSLSDEPDARATLPTPSDILVSYSTFPGYVSWRDTNTGSWYVETLDRILETNAATDDLAHMLIMVNHEVSQISAKGLYKQMPGSFNFLRKLFYFQVFGATMSSYNVKLRRVGITDYDTQIKEVRNQLSEQLRVLDSHLEQKTQVLQDLSDYLRRRGEIEGEYARSLDKLADRFASKTKNKEISTQLQDGLLKVTAELQSTLKTYSLYHTEYLSAEGKLKEATKQEEKQKQSSIKKMERLIEKRQCKVQETQLKRTKARNDYLFNLEAANASMNKYYLQDLSALIDVCEVSADFEVKSELDTRFLQLQTRLNKVTAENEELSKMLQQSHAALLECISEDIFRAEHSNSQSMENISEISSNKSTQARRRSNLQEMENTYCMPGHWMVSIKGLHHEGIFRVSGSQLEVNRLRDLFERGVDPLDEETCDLDSVAGVLKLYFRGMENPLFSKESYEQLMECGRTEDDFQKVAQLKAVILSYPSPLIVMMRYLFAFLHHLIRGPEDADPVTLQQINDLVKTIIIQQENIFPSRNDLDGPVYETCMTLEQDDIEATTEESEVEADVSPNKEVNDELEGVALYDYTARSPAELSFLKGGHVRLYSRASFDWWRGEIDGCRGLIPDKYISVPSMEVWQANKERHNSQPDERPAGLTQTRRIRIPSDKSGLSSSQTLAGKISLQLPTAQPTSTSPSPQMRRTTADIEKEDVKLLVDKKVCHQMNTVFKELLVRQQQQDQFLSCPVPPSTLSYSSVSPQTLRRATMQHKGTNSSKPAEQMNREVN
ncbi:Caspase-9 [Bagarius yarrelli]|uniref:Caspase-9 n=1 Tax=Bagarius yarrelli TaxID=175774 RepID=A0A556U0J3_BAGYA|nr:Caspase-9 [Bagarius yarrelli]